MKSQAPSPQRSPNASPPQHNTPKQLNHFGSTTSSRFVKQTKSINDDLAKSNFQYVQSSNSIDRRAFEVQDALERAKRFYDLNHFNQLSHAVGALKGENKFKMGNKHVLATNLRSMRLSFDPKASTEAMSRTQNNWRGDNGNERRLQSIDFLQNKLPKVKTATNKERQGIWTAGVNFPKSPNQSINQKGLYSSIADHRRVKNSVQINGRKDSLSFQNSRYEQVRNSLQLSNVRVKTSDNNEGFRANLFNNNLDKRSRYINVEGIPNSEGAKNELTAAGSIKATESQVIFEGMAPQTMNSMFESSTFIDVLDPKFDFYDGLDSLQEQTINSIKDGKQSGQTTIENRDDEDKISLESNDTVLAKLIQMQTTKKKQNRGKKIKLPFYLTDTLPDKRQLPAKMLASSIPDNVERPPVEKMSEMINQLYKIELIKKQRVLAKQQKREENEAQQNRVLSEQQSTQSAIMRKRANNAACTEDQEYMKLFGVEGAQFHRNNATCKAHKAAPEAPTENTNQGTQNTEYDVNGKPVSKNACKKSVTKPANKRHFQNGQKIALKKQEEFLKIPIDFMSQESRMIFDNFKAISAGSDDVLRRAPDEEKTFLHGRQEIVPERVGDYLGPKIPSLLEFLENKIHMKEVQGISQIPASTKGPELKPHTLPNYLRQEEKLVNLMNQKNSYHTNVVFASEQNPLEPTKKAASPRKVDQPLLDIDNRQKLLVLAKNGGIVSEKVHKGLLEKVTFETRKKQLES